MKKNFLKDNFSFWRRLINVWSFIFFVIIIMDFAYNNAYIEILNAMSVIYVSVLTIYVSNKEFERWYDRHKESHPGEIFVIAWTVIIILLFVLDLFYTIYTLPGSVVSTYIAVLTILVITRKSKELYALKHKKK